MTDEDKAYLIAYWRVTDRMAAYEEQQQADELAAKQKAK